MLPARIDVAIIGGGFAGCATAWALARRGVQAVVLEREVELGRFASGRGAGLGRQLAEDDATTALTVRGAEILRSELAVAWNPCGGLLTFDEPSRVQAYVSRAERHALAIEVVDRTRVLSQWPEVDGLPIAAGILIPSDGVIAIHELLAVYAASARVELGVVVQRVEPGGIGAQVTTNRGVIEARVVVDAAGAWAGAATGDPPLDAYKRHLFVIEAVSRASTPYLWHLGNEELYLRSADGLLLTSACDATHGAACDAEADPEGVRGLREVLAKAAPVLQRAGIRKQWACQRSFTPDRQMRLGRDPGRPWLVWAAGLGGHGATASPAVGQIVADAIGS
jgi:glycine/D-amino acid oxidase-like deaminating enzyme